MRLLPLLFLVLTACPGEKPADDSTAITDDSTAITDDSTGGTDDSAPTGEQDCNDEVDNDGDGAYDCDDTDCAADPACSLEDCAAPGDEDGDGAADCDDADCADYPDCQTPAEDCGNGADDDGDGNADCDDRDCNSDPACQPVEDCSAPGDEDGDGDPNCLDSDCATDPACLGGEVCGNGTDDDADGDIDCADSECGGDPACAEDCSNGADDDLDGAADCADTDCDLEPACAEDCADGADNDGDGLTDCDDAACDTDPACIVCFESDLASSYGDSVAAGNTAGQGSDRDPTCAFNTGVEDVIYSWVAPSTGLWIFDTAGSDYDTLLAIEVNVCGTGTDCDDDSGDGATSYIEAVLTAGDTVYIVVDGYSGTGNYVLNINPSTEVGCDDGVDDDSDGATDCDDADCTADPACAPEAVCDDGADDDDDGLTDCDDADCAADFVCGSTCTDDHLGRGVGLLVSDYTAGMGDDRAITCGSGEDIAWSWTAPAAATWTFSSSNTALSLQEGDCTEIEIGCDAGGIVSATLAEGETVVLVVEGGGPFDLYATPDVEIDCADGIDEDGDSLTDCDDPDCADALQTWYPDTDGDRFGETGGLLESCGQPAGYVVDGGDCDETSASVHPWRYEDQTNSIDDDCDGNIDAADTDVPTAYTFNDDDSDEYIFSSFSYDFCGASYGSVFVSSNGIVAFDDFMTDYYETDLTFTGPGTSPAALVAGLWDDLDPSAGGTIEVIEYSDAVGIYYRDVPEIGTTNLNTFSIILLADGRVWTEHDSITAADGLTGWSCGTGDAADTADVTAARAALTTAAGIGRGTEDALYELFLTGNDLSGSSTPWCVQSGSDDDGDGTTGACGDADDLPGI